MPDAELRQFARTVLEVEAAAVRAVAGAVDESFERAARLMLDCPGSVLVSGMGKAGHVARKVAATLASTGTPAHFLSPTDAVHGDLGAIRQGDIVVLLSGSGESDEILRLLSIVKKLGHPVVAITAGRTNSLGRFADVTIATGKIAEACPLGLAPSASTTAMLALGDALALTVMHLRKFTAEDFAVFHPAGQLGRKLVRVREAMTFRVGENLPIATEGMTVGQVLHERAKVKRPPGAVIVVDGGGKLSGLFTDGDLRRLVTDNDGTAVARPIDDVMTRNPKRIGADALASEAFAVMHQGRFDELPVVDEADRPVGLIDVQDLVVLKMLDVEPEAS
ncbi:MAG TPA: KpsF/GutQ family sugar-phosphate isomerase [Tepidisphaeraceae bacterium]|nr:KpsF/GutQ family sugar-phosphate isomerase [Tepidisphaeraceae bacterium]